MTLGIGGGTGPGWLVPFFTAMSVRTSFGPLSQTAIRDTERARWDLPVYRRDTLAACP